jgi:predicted DNA-binding transcriptional regulator AlpA
MECVKVSEPLNSAQIALADGIAERVAAALREDAAAGPVRMFQSELMRSIARACAENPSLRTLIDAAVVVGHNGGPPLDDETGVMTIPEFCAWAKIGKSTLYELWTQGAGPKRFNAGTATRISRAAAREWILAREAAAGAESRQIESGGVRQETAA